MGHETVDIVCENYLGVCRLCLVGEDSGRAFSDTSDALLMIENFAGIKVKGELIIRTATKSYRLQDYPTQ